MERTLKLADVSARARVAPLFDGWEETLIWSALEGAMGQVWTLAEDERAALCAVGDFLLLAGDEECAEELLTAWREARAGKYGILAARGKALNEAVARVFGEAASECTRWAFPKQQTFDGEALRAFEPPEGVALKLFDAELYRAAMAREWSRDFCSQFASEEDFLARGLGVAAMAGGELIGGASSYTVYGKGIEIQVETREDWRRRGVAAACAARLVGECLRRGLCPSWDAANEASVRLARRIGYRGERAYSAWELYQESEA